MSTQNSFLQRGRAAAIYYFMALSLAQGFHIPYHLQQQSQHRIGTMVSSSKDIVDVEFERVPDEEDKPKKRKSTKQGKKKGQKSLIDMSLDSDPRWKEARIPFVDTARSTAIEGKVAFVVELEGVQYGIAVPFDAPAAITLEDTDGSVTNFYPDEDENEELMEIMAAQLVEQVGADLSLRRTPRVLTIQGDLEKYTENWQEELLPPPTPISDLLGSDDDDDDDLAWAHEFFRKELGEEEYEKTMNEPTTAEDIGDELMEFFDIAGMGERSDDLAGLEKMFEALETEEDPMQTMVNSLGEDPLDHDGAALKLISYNFENGKAYSLVKLLKPYLLVGRLAQDKDDLEFELLTPEESKVVVPKLEQVCRKDLEDAGFNLSP